MKIVSMAPSATDWLLALGAAEELTAVTAYCRLPKGMQRPELPGWSNLTPEHVLGYKPDLVITSSVVQEKLAADLRKAGLKVMHQDPRRLDEVWESGRELGLALGRETQAEAAIKSATFRWQALVDRGNTSVRPRVYVEEWHDPPTASGNWVPELVQSAGGLTWPGMEPGQLSAPIPEEALLEFNPQMVLHSLCGLATAYDPVKFAHGDRTKLEAVKEGRLFTIDDSLINVPSPRLVEGLEMVQDIIGECFWGWQPVGRDGLRRLARA